MVTILSALQSYVPIISHCKPPVPDVGEELSDPGVGEVQSETDVSKELSSPGDTI